MFAVYLYMSPMISYVYLSGPQELLSDLLQSVELMLVLILQPWVAGVQIGLQTSITRRLLWTSSA